LKATQNPFRINIGFLINQPIGYSREIPIELDKLVLSEDLTVRELKGTITLIRNQDGFRSQAIFDAEIDNECGRCLEKFSHGIESEFEEFFTFPFVESSDEEISVPEDGNVDFTPLVHDYLLMEIPINAVCKDDCKGLCDVCGINLNNKTCGNEKKSDKDTEPIRGNNGDWDSVKKALKP